MPNVVVVIGAGQIGQAIARRVSVGKHVVLADRSEADAIAAAEVMSNVGYQVTVATVDVSSRPAVHALVGKAAEISMARRSCSKRSQRDRRGWFRRRHLVAVWPSPARAYDRPEQGLGDDADGRTARAAFLQLDQVKDSLYAYQLSKRGNSLRVMAEAVRWGKRGARINTISPGIIMTPLAKDELTGPRGAGYRRMIEGSVARRGGTPDEVGAVGALLMGPRRRRSAHAIASHLE
jgi:NAD(P)-dependent dehydrogenase (short-subunit alcohol dehydrogenase family)